MFSTKRGQSSLWVRQIATESAVQIVPPETHRVIADAEFTPEGSYLDYTAYASFATEGKVYQIPVLGGTPRRLLDDGNTGVSFSPDGHQMAYAIFNPLSSEGVLGCWLGPLLPGWQLQSCLQRSAQLPGDEGPHPANSTETTAKDEHRLEAME